MHGLMWGFLQPDGHEDYYQYSEDSPAFSLSDPCGDGSNYDATADIVVFIECEDDEDSKQEAAQNALSEQIASGIFGEVEDISVDIFEDVTDEYQDEIAQYFAKKA